jgi:hypothetical protein
VGELRRKMQANDEAAAHVKRQRNVNAAKGRDNVKEFVELMREHAVPPSTIFKSHVETWEKPRGFGPWRTVLLMSETHYSIAGQAWLLQDRGWDRSHQGYYFVIPGQGIVEVRHATLPTSSRLVGWKEHNGAQYVRGSVSVPARTTRQISQTVALPGMDEHAFDVNGTKCIYEVPAETNPDNSDLAFAVWATDHAVDTMAATAKHWYGLSS